MRTSRATGSVIVTVTAATLLIAMSAAPSAQRRRTDNSVFGTPVATNTVLKNPEKYYGKLVTISAGVEEMLSKTTFVVDQRKAASLTTVKAVGKPLLVVAPYLTSELDQKHYVLMRGEIVKLDSTAIARLASDFQIDLAPELGAKYQGQPILLATSIFNSTYTEVARKPIAPPTAAEIKLTATMKIVAPSFAALRAAAQESKGDLIKEHLATLGPAFADTERIFADLGHQPGAARAREASAQLASIEAAATAGNWEEAKSSAGALNQLCQNCHGAYRERQDDGTFRVRKASF